jgi:hypothetical protein
MFASILPPDFPAQSVKKRKRKRKAHNKHHKNFLSFSSLSLSLSLFSLSVSIQNHGTIIDDDSIVLIDEDIDSSIET